MKVQAVSGQEKIAVRGLPLRFQAYVFRQGEQPVYAFHCLWKDRAAQQQFVPEVLTWRARIGTVTAGERQLGQRSLQLVLWGAHDLPEAVRLLRAELPRLVVP